MKKQIITALWLFTGLALFSQTYEVKYYYDNAGNRSHRWQSQITYRTYTDSSVVQDIDKQVYSQNLGERSITLFPNPTKGQLEVEITGKGIPEQSSIGLFTLQGELLLLSKNIRQANPLNLSDKKPGTYLLTIKLGNELSTWKVIKE